MGYFSSYIGGSKPTKYLIAGRIAALIMCVKDDIGVSGLIAGSIVLNSDFTVAFRGGGGARDSKYLANVSPKVQLEGFLTDSEIQEIQARNTWQLATKELAIVDRLTYAVITAFEKQSAAFERLEEMFKPKGGYVFLGRSAQFREAEKRSDKYGMGKLLGQGVEIHYLMQTYESMGEAKARERNESISFVGGVVDSYEVLVD